MEGRKINKLLLFDVDGTLSPSRKTASPEMISLLLELRKIVAIGFVGGSDLAKQQEQLGTNERNVVDMFDYAFAENGLTAYKLGKPLPAASFIQFLGEAKYQQLVNFCLRYIADLEIPVKRGTFIEFRKGMVNVSPVGRNVSSEERAAFYEYDKEHNVRPKFIEDIKKAFPNLGLTYSIGGEISFDVFPTGWDKTYALRHVENEGYDEIHFFGDKTYPGGNDWEIYNDPRVIGHSVKNPAETMAILKDMFHL